MKPHEDDENTEELKALETELDDLSNSVQRGFAGRRNKTNEEEQKSLARKRKKADKCAEQMSLRTILKNMLEADDNKRAKNITEALINNAELGDTKSYEIIFKVLTDEIGHDEDNNPLQPIRVNISFDNNQEGIRDKE